MIVEGDLAAGERLHDANLAATLKVRARRSVKPSSSWRPKGLSILLPGRGARVSDFSIDDIKQLFEAIAGIERNACELGRRADDRSGLEKLQRLYTAPYGASSRRWRASALFQSLNHEIHLAIVARQTNTAPAGDPHILDDARPRARTTPRSLHKDDGLKRWRSTRVPDGRPRGARRADARAKSCTSTIFCGRPASRL